MLSRRLFISVGENLVREPIIYQLVKQFDVVPNVRRANVLATEAWVVLELEAQSEKQLQQSIEYLRGIGATVEAVEGDFMES
jgi:L-aspartate semialdehyde sulfurtransferase ferredoxin